MRRDRVSALLPRSESRRHASGYLPDSADNPFPGPQSYTADQRAFFFGRDLIIEDLTAVVLSSSIVLLNAPSGNGKSSVLEAGLVTNLKPFGVRPYPIVRFGGDDAVPDPAPAGADAANPDAANPDAADPDAADPDAADPDAADPDAADSDAAGRQPRNPFVTTIGQYLLPDGGEPERLATLLTEARPAAPEFAVLLVLDQFERVFHDAALWSECAAFFAQLAEAAAADPLLRIVIGIRSDYLAEFLFYEENYARGSVTNFSLDSLTEPETREVITRAFEESGIELGADEVQALLDALFELPAPNAARTVARAQYVNLIQLQILCRRLWQQRSAVADTGSTLESLRKVGDVQQSMEDFVDEAVARVVREAKVNERALRTWLAEELVTGAGHRGAAPADDEKLGIGPRVVDALDHARLVKVEWRNGSRWAELVHDSMVGALADSNRRWAKHRRASRRSGKVLSLALLLAVLAGALLLRPRPDSNVLASFDSTVVRGNEVQGFTGARQRPVSVVQLSIDSGSAPGLSLQVVGLDGPQAGQSLASKPIAGDGRYASASLALPTEAGHRYQVRLVGRHDLLVVSGLIRAAELGLDADYWTANAGKDLFVPDGGLAIALPSDQFVQLSTDDSLPDFTGGTVVYDGYRTSVVVGGPDRFLYFEPGSPTRVSIRRILNTAPVLAGASVHAGGQLAVVPVTVEPGDLPVTVATECPDPADISITDRRGVREGNTDTESGRSMTWLTQASGAGYYVTINHYNPSSTGCTVTVTAPDRHPLSGVGASMLTVPTGQFAAARGLSLSSDALLTVPAVTGVAASVTCGRSAPVASGPSHRLVAFLPAGTRCVLLLERGGERARPVAVQVQIAGLPVRSGTAPR